MQTAEVSLIGIALTTVIAVIGGSITLAIKLPRLMLDLQRRVERPLGFVTFVMVIFWFGFTKGRPEAQATDPFQDLLNLLTGFGIALYWLIVVCTVVAKYVLADREERNHRRGDRPAPTDTEDE